MPAPRTVAPLPVIAGLPIAFRLQAEFFLTHHRSSPDYLLLLAEAAEEVAGNDQVDPRPARALRTLAAELRRRAPEYA